MSTLAQHEPQKLTRLVAAFVEPNMRERLERAARENERSLSGEVRLALRRHLEGFARDIPPDPGEGDARGRAGGPAPAGPAAQRQSNPKEDT